MLQITGISFNCIINSVQYRLGQIKKSVSYVSFDKMKLIMLVESFGMTFIPSTTKVCVIDGVEHNMIGTIYQEIKPNVFVTVGAMFTTNADSFPMII